MTKTGNRVNRDRIGISNRGSKFHAGNVSVLLLLNQGWVDQFGKGKKNPSQTGSDISSCILLFIKRIKKNNFMELLWVSLVPI